MSTPGRGTRFDLLEGTTVMATPAVPGVDVTNPRAVLTGPRGRFAFDETLLSHHILFIGSIGSGKTNAMQQLVASLRSRAKPDDVFVVFDTKGDFRDEFFCDGDRVISNEIVEGPGRAHWNLFADMREEGTRRTDEAFEIASAVFADSLDHAGDNLFFAAAARDLFAGAVDALAITRGGGAVSNEDLRAVLEGDVTGLWNLLKPHPHLGGLLTYLTSDTGTSNASILAFLRQTVRSVFSGSFTEPGDFSVREFVREKAGSALFIEYDIAAGAVLVPTYRLLIDLAIKEALSRGRSAGSVYLVLDEFALMPRVPHLKDALNFGRSLGVKCIVATQNAAQVREAYGADGATSVLSAFGTIFAFRLMDEDSRALVQGRYGRNRKVMLREQAVRGQGVREEIYDGQVIEDWELSRLGTGTSIVAPVSGSPFWFAFDEFSSQEVGLHD